MPKFYIGSTSEIKALSGKYFGSVKSEKWKKNLNDKTNNF